MSQYPYGASILGVCLRAHCAEMSRQFFHFAQDKARHEKIKKGQSVPLSPKIQSTNKSAEWEGFEPPVPFKRYTRFPSEHLQPLGHHSMKTKLRNRIAT